MATLHFKPDETPKRRQLLAQLTERFNLSQLAYVPVAIRLVARARSLVRYIGAVPRSVGARYLVLNS